MTRRIVDALMRSLAPLVGLTLALLAPFASAWGGASALPLARGATGAALAALGVLALVRAARAGRASR